MTIPVERLQNQSVFYYLKGVLPSGITLTPAFPISQTESDPPLTLPTVSIDSPDLHGVPLELGNNETKQERLWAIEVFANTPIQRDDLSYLIYHALESGVIVKDYNFGFPPSYTPPEIGLLDVSDIRVKPVYVFRDLVKDLYWRNSITFSTEYRLF